MRDKSNPTGKCQCGCGLSTSIIKRNDTNAGLVKGQYRLFIYGHSGAGHPRAHVLYLVNLDTGCWLWNGRKTKAGYGQYVNEEHKRVYAHRWMYENVNGPIPAGLEIDHKITCPKNCVNPDHLEAVTGKVNIQRGRGAKLYREAAIDICTSGLPARVLAERYGVGRRQIYYVRSGRTWSNHTEGLR